MGNRSDISNNAVVYARFSSSGQKEQSIDGQLAAARQYAEKKGYTIIKEYCDRAKTGTNDNREAFQQMLSDTAKKQFSVIIVWKVDRFGRNREEITFNKYRAKKNGVRVEYVAENLPDSPEAVILESVLEGMAEYYSLQLSQNVKRGLLENAKAHRAVTGVVPLGYRLTPDKYYEIDPDTAPIVKLIFQKYASGETLFDLIRYLNDQGFTTSKGKPYSRTSLDKMLKNEKYIGTYTFKDIIHDEDAIPAIVDKETFRKVQEMLETNKRAPSTSWKRSDYILTGKLFCGHCGSPMMGRAGTGHCKTKYSYYYCKSRIQNEGCTKKPVRKEWIEDIVLTEVQRLLDDDDLIRWIADQTWQYYLEQDTQQTEIEALQKELESTETASKRLLKAVEDGMPFNLVKDRLDELEEQKETIRKALAEQELARGFRLSKEYILFFLDKFRKLDITDRKCQKKLLQVFVNAIFLYDDHIKIAFNYADGNGSRAIQLSDIEKIDPCGESSHGSMKAWVSVQNANFFGKISWSDSVFVITYHLSP